MNDQTILIIEDDLALLRGLSDNFKAYGYKVRTASDGRRGLYALLAEPPDVVLLDLMLPQVNGYDICEAARSHHLHMPILMLTARSEEADILRGLKCGADDYVTKPFNIADLINRVEALGWLEAGNESQTDVPDNPRALAHGLAPAGE